MFTNKNVSNFTTYEESSLSDALQKINKNQCRIIFAVDEKGHLVGSLSDGDIRRWLIDTDLVDVNVSIKDLMNVNFKYVNAHSSKEELDKLFSSGIDCIPVLDDNKHLVSIVFQKKNGIFVGEREISDQSDVFIIAEVGNNHQGDLDLGKKLIDIAAKAGVDCVKFQMRSMKALYKNSGSTEDDSVDLGAQYTLDLLSKFQLPDTKLIELFDYAKTKGLIPLCTPWDKQSLAVLESYGMEAYKVASADFTNHDLLEAIANTGKPFFCSTGMSDESEIKETVSFLNSMSANYVLLHCNSTYPTPYKDVRLNYLLRLKNITNQLVGYSGHERGIHVSVAAVALGSCVIEKHITTDKSLEGTDHKVSLLPNELDSLVKEIRDLEDALGSSKDARSITQGELMNRENLAKSIVSNRDIEIGEVITRDMIEIKSPGLGLQPNRLKDLVGIKANRKIKNGDYFYKTDIQGQVYKRNYSFDRPFGVPVRYHDFSSIVDGTNMDFIEFHLSYKDLKASLENYFPKKQNLGFAVHCPELFENDHILDLCSDDKKYRELSIQHLTKVVEITNKLKEYFPNTEKPVIVLNAGGWNADGFIDDDFKDNKYKMIEDALNKIDLRGVTIAIQTMPPFPWHFGGQSFHNLFVNADEIELFCNNNPNIKICFDVSHSMMSCNYYGWDLYKFTSKISKYIAHMHIVDALGSDGEGIKIGDGDVNFPKLCNILNEKCPNIQFIPEVWQGHKNKGEGFWGALEYLENAFSLKSVN